MPPTPESITLSTLQDPSEALPFGQNGASNRMAGDRMAGDRMAGDSDAAPVVSDGIASPSSEDSTADVATGSPLHWLIGAHWLGRWRTPVAIRLWRYGAGSVVAFVTSAVVLFVCLSWFKLGAITATVIAFFAGAIPNWVLNRRWAWEKRGREGVVRETTLYVIVSVIALVASSATDKFTAVEAAHLRNALAKSVLVTFAYMFSVVVLTGLKYVAYDRLVFVDRSAPRGERRSRHQVPTTTEPNR
jgi:putative flippase GtrA